MVQKTHAKLLLEICDVSNGKHFAASILRGKTSVPSCGCNCNKTLLEFTHRQEVLREGKRQGDV